MERIQKSVYVDLPLQAVYNQWTQFEEFPLFMEGVKHVEQLDDKRLLTGMWRLLENPKSGTRESLSRSPINGSPGKAKPARTPQGWCLSKQTALIEPRSTWNSFMIPRDLSNRPEIRLGLYRGALRMTLSTSKNLSRTATARPGRGAAPSGSRALHIPTLDLLEKTLGGKNKNFQTQKSS